MPVLMLVAALVILAGVVVVASGRGGEMAPEYPDYPPIDLGPVSAADVAMLRPPSAAWGYNMRVTDEALETIARAVTERDVKISALQQEVSDLRGELAQDWTRGTVPTGTAAGQDDRAKRAPGEEWPDEGPGPAQPAWPRDEENLYEENRPRGNTGPSAEAPWPPWAHPEPTGPPPSTGPQATEPEGPEPQGAEPRAEAETAEPQTGPQGAALPGESPYPAPPYEEPSYEEPSYEEPSHEEPSHEGSSYEEPSHEGSSYEEPSHEGSSYEEPSYEEPAHEEPAHEPSSQDGPVHEAAPHPAWDGPDDQADWDEPHQTLVWGAAHQREKATRLQDQEASEAQEMSREEAPAPDAPSEDVSGEDTHPPHPAGPASAGHWAEVTAPPHYGEPWRPAPAEQDRE